MKLYNTASRHLEDFHPENETEVKIYTCGPTVYDVAHIGNFTSYIYWDLLVRTLKANGYKVNRVLNLTDVGHLTSDADEGPDKLEKGAKREGKTVWEIAEKYIDIFLTDFRKLNLTEPDHICRATDYIEEDIKLVDTLTKKGFTYETTDGIYFDTSKFPRYADFARLDLEGLKAGARIGFNNEKRNVSDFALWKFIQPGENHAMRWDYLGRPGYPGWHVECSAIIHKELGEPIDIHTGGIDHIPVHHTNEIAQSESAFEKTLANYWLHCNFITIDNQKVSKSLGNTYNLDQLAEKGFTPADFKMWVYQGHYQSDRNFSFTDLAAAKARRLHWRNNLALNYQLKSADKTDQILDTVLAAVSDNLNSSAAFSAIDAAIDAAAGAPLPLEIWQKIDDLFGLNLIKDTPDIASEQKDLIKKRQTARTAKDWSTSDTIRDQLAKENITILDTEATPIWQYMI